MSPIGEEVTLLTKSMLSLITKCTSVMIHAIFPTRSLRNVLSSSFTLDVHYMNAYVVAVPMP
jgi:hypothetical protein